MTPAPSPLPAGTSRDRCVPRGRVWSANHGSGWGLPNRPLHAAVAQEEALWGYQPRSGGGERRKDVLRGGVPEVGHGGAVRSVVRSLCPTIAALPLLQVDPMLTLEEQQLRELQRHGYENPTYRFLEERP